MFHFLEYLDQFPEPPSKHEEYLSCSTGNHAGSTLPEINEAVVYGSSIKGINL